MLRYSIFFLVIRFLRDYLYEMYIFVAIVFQSLSHVSLFATCTIIGPSLSSTISRSLFKFMSTESVMLSNHLIHCHPFLLLPSIFATSGSSPMSWLFTSSGQVLELQIQQYSFQWIIRVDFPWDWLVLSPYSPRVFSSTTVQKHQFFSAQSSFWSNSHIHTWLLEKP